MKFAAEDKARVNDLRQMFNAYEKWSRKPGIIELSNNDDFGSGQFGMKEYYVPFSDAQIREIIQSTRFFYDELKKGSSKNMKDDLARSVILSTANAYSKNSVHELPQAYPFLYVMLCVSGKSIFSQRSSRDNTILKNKLTDARGSKPYDARPFDLSRQRLARIRFLDQLNTICLLSPKLQLYNWQLFLLLHGAEIKSQEENALWAEIVIRLPGVVPIELQRTVSQYLDSCLPPLPEQLFCYRGGSVIHKGGFFSYTKRFPEVSAEVKSRIGGSSYWHKAEEEYFENAFRYDYDPSSIYSWMKKQIQRAVIKWDKIPNASDDEMRSFCETLYHGTDRPQHIEDNVTELRALLLEYALREDAAARIKRALKDSFQSYMNSVYRASVTVQTKRRSGAAAKKK